MKINWTKEFPKVNGWYWIKYQWENWELSDGEDAGPVQNCCPCEVVFYMGVPYVRLEGCTITEKNRLRFGFVDIEFSPKIEQPDEVVFEEPDAEELGESEFEDFQFEEIEKPDGEIDRGTDMKTNTLPPAEIYDALHEAEAKGVELPASVEQWWTIETDINENPTCQKCKRNHGIEKLECELCPELNDIILTRKTLEDDDDKN